MVMTCHVQAKSTLNKLRKALGKIQKLDVLVGIPAENAQRKENKGNSNKKPNNAELLFIHTHGVRSPGMRTEMQANMSKGMSYSAAHQLYIKSHGSPALNVPARPVLQPSIKANKDSIGKHLQTAAKAALKGNQAGYMRGLNAAGQRAVNAARSWFTDPRNNWPPNSPETIRRKGSDKPLIDTGEMRKAITYVIRDK